MDHIRSAGIALACKVVTCAMLASAGNVLAAPETYVVAVEDMRFSPATLKVKRGDRIVWINKDLFPHTVTADNRAFDSGSLPANASWSYVTGRAGTYPYGCSFHPTMHGSLTVR
ncbi:MULTISPECIES: cupredoxin domain-containing protein [Paraburkholderia]|uniref:cupredoxin domain-containing protein n=1 Tax=Paraburkholderia TaxID=1822464 RepID=UPI000368A2B7|nr:MULTISPECIES: cupredoxin family copper-binding protein [Paraburkholderia]MDH6153708.1 plastocyanin [Paraburkholderia sp. WSM4179]